jgi:asparagine synthase (glutamine-hydrolysing)
MRFIQESDHEYPEIRMCGLAGIFTVQPGLIGNLAEHIRRMTAPIEHRGPDDGGIWSDEAAGIGFGFRRLSIIDLSEHGHQPMRSVSGRYTLVFNGEVYNHGELRRELVSSGFRFRGGSDTETILASFEEWGVRAAIQRFVGMFAMAVWDAENRSLSLIRDRLGIKPLFIYSRPGHLMFGSELKALVAGPSFDRSLSTRAVEAYLRYLYIPGPDSIFEHVQKLLPGHILTVRSVDEPLPATEAYWSVHDAAHRGMEGPLGGSETEAVDGLEQILEEAIRLRLQADVPVGALLSGGIDSSTVVALAQAASSRPIRTYSIGFDVAEYDETAAAARVANHLGTEHTELMLTGQAALNVVPALPDLFDEPLADPSQIPTYLICKLARTEVTVALSGDGGDEILAGYHRYIQGERMIAGLQRVPPPIRHAMAAAMGTVSSTNWDRMYNAVRPVLPAALHHRLPGEKLVKIGALMAGGSASGMYRSLLSAWQAPARLMTAPNGGHSSVDDALHQNRGLPLLERMMATDQVTYLADDLLAKVDRASMAVSMEVRVPLLDHRVVEYAWRMPRSMKIRGGQGKWALRQILYRHVPRELVERPKMGFSVPIATWLRGPLRSWAGDLLFSSRSESEELLDRTIVRRAWNALQGGQLETAPAIWAVLMLAAWRERWVA